MRILQVVTLVSPDAAYGGPLRVALNQAAALQDLGHKVTIAGATRGYNSPPAAIEGVRAKLFPARRIAPVGGFASLISPGLQRWLKTALRNYDVLHVHFARDLITIPAAASGARRGVPLVLQTHGMIDHSDRWSAEILDALVTRRLLRSADAVLHLTSKERRDLIAAGTPASHLIKLRNGVPLNEGRSDPSVKEVLFLARLQHRKRPLAFVEAAVALSRRYPDWRFALVGPDEGEGDVVSRAIRRSDDSRLVWEGALALSQTADRMARASIYVLPSVDEPYPMSVLEAMATGLPVVVTKSNGLASTILSEGCGLVANDSVQDLTLSIERLMASHDLRRACGERSLTTVKELFSMKAIGKSLEDIYADATTQNREARATEISANCDVLPQAIRTSKSTQLLIVQPYVPRYRVPFFERLAERLAEDHIHVTVATPRTHRLATARNDAGELGAAVSAAGPSWARSTRFGTLEYFGTARLIRAADCVVMPAAASLFDTQYAVWGPGRSQRRVGIWGHIDAFVKAPNKLDRWIEKRLMVRSDHVFAYTTDGSRFAVSSGIPSEKVTALGNTLDTQELRRERAQISAAQVEAFRHSHSVDSQRSFGYIGALDAAKGIDFLARVLDELHASNVGLKLLVAGDGPLASLLEPALARGQVELLGYADARTKAILTASVEALLNPGRIGLIAVDAMALGVPLVTATTTGHGPEAAYLREGASVFTGPSDPSTFAHWLAARSFTKFEAEPPSLDDMVANFRAGVVAMLGTAP